MSFKTQALKNVGSNWLGAAVTVAVGFLLSPFILHRLGDEAFGLWVLIFSITGYYGIFDFGIRSSIVKYLAEFEVTGAREQLARVVNVSILSYGCVALALLAVTGVCSLYVDSLFHVPAGFLRSARLLVLVAGSAVAAGFPLSVFAGILEGRQEFPFINLTQVVATLLRALLIVLALAHGLGLVTIVAITVLLPVLSYVAYALRVMRVMPLPFGARYVDRATFRRIVHYSSSSFVSQLAFRLRFQSDALIIGAMLSASAITYFSIGSKLLNYSFIPLAGLGQIFTPLSSRLDAAGDRVRLHKLFVEGNRACALVVFPVSAFLLVLGKSLINVWVGSRYESSYVILVILLIPSILSDIQAGSRQILYGLGRHRALAIVNVVEAVVNVVLSIALIRYWGIVGDALGTAIPLGCSAIFFLPLYLCRLLGMRLTDFLKGAYLLPLALSAPLLAVLMILHHLFRPHNLMGLAAQVAAGGAVYGLGLLWLFLMREPLGAAWRTRFREYVHQAFSRP
jgi:O-antigen/teichoic acid export membrane protein